jgi:hypothetical protein
MTEFLDLKCMENPEKSLLVCERSSFGFAIVKKCDKNPTIRVLGVVGYGE